MAALQGMRVLDLTQYEAGPSCCQYLGWLGADVVKVEPPKGEPGRTVFGGADHSQYYENYNANKRGVCIDLAKPAGRELVLSMIANFDVLVENQGPGVMEKLGLGPDVLRGANPRLIYARVKGYGLSGPYKDYKSFDMLAQAAAGLFSITGEPDGPPVRPGGTFADTGTGIHTAFAVAAAYIECLRTGVGQVVEMSMHEAMTMFIRTSASRSWGPEAPPTPRVGNSMGGAPAGMYACKPFGANDYAYVHVATSRMWESLAKAIDRPDLITDERYATGRAREANGEPLRAVLADWCAEHTKFEVMAQLGAAGVPCSAVMDTHDVFHDPHLAERGFVHRLPHPALGEVTLLGKPFRLEHDDVPIRPAPTLGQHTDEVLAADCGLAPDALAALRADGVIR